MTTKITSPKPQQHPPIRKTKTKTSTLNPNPNPQRQSMDLQQEMFIKHNIYELRLEKKIRYHLFIHI